MKRWLAGLVFALCGCSGAAVDTAPSEPPYACRDADRFTCCQSQALQDELTAAQCFATKEDRDAFRELYMESLRSGECRAQHTDDECATR